MDINDPVQDFCFEIGRVLGVVGVCSKRYPEEAQNEDLSKEFWESAARNSELFEPKDAATNLIDVVENLSTKQRGKVWDWAGQEVPW